MNYQEGYMAYLQGWDARRMALYIADHKEGADFEEDLEDFLQGHADAAKENSK